MNEVKILKPDKDGVLRQVRTVYVPAYYATGLRRESFKDKSHYAKTVKGRRYS